MRLQREFAAIALTVLATIAAAAPSRAEETGVYTSIRPDDCLLAYSGALSETRVCAGAFGFTLVIHAEDARYLFELTHPDWAGAIGCVWSWSDLPCALH